ncbi:LacI family DNA-binding transcriptional regulator [Paenarthrobacter sp. NPDC057981]|uniref:LacI family DNA-binding transcriptional regulator n=1 Tax=Paenarthrobacter sp. NPDC057981 TaxID=3346297 RepID=UPI0036D94567
MGNLTKSRRVTTQDIAKSLGVSRATVGFVLNNTPGQTISETTRSRVLEEARRLGYRPHNAARALASGQTRLVLLLLPDWPLDFSLRRNIEEASLTLDEAGYAMITYTPHPTGQARPLWESLQPDVVVALTAFTPEQVTAIRDAGITRLIPDPDVIPENPYIENGPALQLEHLAGLGHRTIAYAGLDDPKVADLVTSRGTRAQETASSLGLPLLASRNIGLTDETAEAALREWRSVGVTAIAAYNDDVAAALTGAALRSGLAVPTDISIIGYDDTPLASMFEPQLSTVRVDSAGLGRYLGRLALSAVEGTPPPAAGPEMRSTLIQRASTGVRG